MKYRDLTWEQAARLCFEGGNIKILDKWADEVDDAAIFSLHDWKEFAEDTQNRYTFYVKEE